MRKKTILIILIASSLFFAGCTGSNGTSTTTTTAGQGTTTTTLNTAGGTSQDEMSVVRTLPNEAESGSTFTVTLVMAFNGTNKPGLLGLTENYPSNWNVTNITSGGVLRQKRSAIEWLFFPPFRPPVQNTTITYQLTIPEGIHGTYFFEGNVTTGSNPDRPITGLDNITIK